MEEMLSEPLENEMRSEELVSQKESDVSQKESDVKKPIQTKDIPEALGKRLNKRKQRFPTRQTVDLMRALQKVKQGKLDASQNFQKNVKDTKSEKSSAPKVIKKSKKEEKRTEVVLRRSSRPVKKKKMFDELDEPEVKPESKPKKGAKMTKEAPFAKKKPSKNKKAKTEEEKAEVASDADRLEVGQREESKSNEITTASNIDCVNSKVDEEQINVVTNKEEDTSEEKQDQANEDNAETRENIESEKKESMDIEKGKIMETESLVEDKNDKENKNVALKRPIKLKKKYICLLCEKGFSSSKALRRHDRNIHKECNEEFKCDECEKVLKSKKAYDRHLLVHTDSSYQCYECGQKFFSHVKVKQHVRSAHGGILPFKCGHEGCEKRFTSTSNRKKHIEAVHLNLRNHNCCFCEKGFKNSSALRVHLISLHPEHFQNRPKFVCNVCGKVFTQKLKLRMHESVHTTIRPYKCRFEDCGRTFRLKSNKVKHERVHENFRPYTCDTCGQAFSRRIYLETHQYKHTGVKQYKCTICQKTFSQKGNLNIHMKIHSKDRPFVSCDICGKTFSNKSNLTKHKQSTCTGSFHAKPLQQKVNPKEEAPDSAETVLRGNEISFILQEMEVVDTRGTVFIIQDENKPGKTDKACGTDDVKCQQFVRVPEASSNDRGIINEPSKAKLDFSTYKPNAMVHDEIVTVLNPSTAKQGEIVMTNAPKQLQSLLTNTITPSVFESHIIPQSSAEKQDIVVHPKLQSNKNLEQGSKSESNINSEGVALTTQLDGRVPDFHTYLAEKWTTDVKATNGEQIREQTADPTTELASFNTPANVTDSLNTLADIVLPASSENVEYEIISSGLDGVEEGILKEFLNKWSQQGSSLGSTVILDVQNAEQGAVTGADGVTVPESVQYIVTVKEQE